MPLILCKDASYVDPIGILKTGQIIIRNDTIEAVLPQKEHSTPVLPDRSFDEIIPSSAYLIMPGLMNCHTHIPMVLFRGLGDDLPLTEWLQTKIFPLEEKLYDEAVYIGSLLGIAELLHSGCTFFADMYFYVEAIAKACVTAGIKANLSLGLLDPKGESGLQQSEALYHALNGSNNHMLSFFLGPHAPYTCSPDYLEKIVRTAEKLNTGLHIHLNETEEEVRNIFSLYQLRPIELMEKIGLFSRPVIAAHCVHTSDQERTILQKSNTLVVHNPSSNCKLASGIAPVETYHRKGIQLAIGTDGAASNNQLNLFKEIHLASMLSKVSEKLATSFPSQYFYPFLYRNPTSFFFPEQTPGIQAGGKADLIFIQKGFSHLFPQENWSSHLLYSMQGNEVSHIMIEGKWIMKDSVIKTFDEAAVQHEFANIYRKMLAC